ncbi:MAG: YfhO family protein, partial [Sediminibacterium sp.]|nr:YfhO family protein [Sediminibacterium sp.]
MKNFQWKSLLPHLIAVGIFLVVAVIYCKPALEGKVLQQGDVVHWKGMAQDMFNYKETHGHFPLWNNNLFGGMPGYQVAMESYSPIPLIFMHKVFMLFLPKPIGYFFLLCIMFYFLTQVAGARSWLGILGGIAYAYATYGPVIVSVGHDTKMQAMGYLPALLASLWLIYQRRYLWGAALTALFSALLVGMNHLQVTYYFLIVAGFMTFAYLVKWIREKQYRHLALSLGIALAAGGVGAAFNMVALATTSDYAKATMRGGSLSIDSTGKSSQTSGLGIDYAFTYGSYGLAESFTYLVPGMYGGPVQLDANSHFAKLAVEKGIPEDQALQFAGNMPTYWGDQPANSGPVYLGAIICFLFIFGIVYLRSWHKWWILAVCVLAILMSWGKNFEAFNSFMFHYLPLYNKFRAPSIILVIPQLLFPLVAVMALQQFLFEETDRTKALQKLKTSVYITAGIFAVLIGFYLSFTYTHSGDENLKAGLTQALGGKPDEAASFFAALKEDRKSLFGADLLRSLLLVAAAAAALWLVAKNKIKAMHALIAIILLASFDVLSVGRRYLNDNNYQDAEALNDSYFKASPIDLEIQKDTTHPRVLNMTQSDPFADALTAYFHRSVGGYHPAKLSIYDDMLTHQLRKQPMNVQVLNMLNAKYIIVPDQQTGQPSLQVNPNALGQAWFVPHILFVKDAGAAMKALDTVNPKDTAIVEEKFKTAIPFTPVADSGAAITLVKNDNDEITYHAVTKTNQFAVFSEIF